MNRKICCPDFAFPLMEHDKVLKLIALLGMKGIDIGLFENRSHIQPSDQYRNLKYHASELRKKTEDNGLSISDVFVQGDKDFHRFAANHYDDKEREQSRELFLRTLEYAGECGAQHVTALPGVHFVQESFAQSYDRCVEEQKWRVEKAAEYNISYGCEAHIGSICADIKIAKQLCEDSGMRLTLDYSHFVREHLMDEFADCLIPYATHFHIRGASDGVLQAAMKDNQIDFKRILSKLDDANYTGWFCAESCWTPEWEDCYKNDNISDIILVRNFLMQN